MAGFTFQRSAFRIRVYSGLEFREHKGGNPTRALPASSENRCYAQKRSACNRSGPNQLRCGFARKELYIDVGDGDRWTPIFDPFGRNKNSLYNRPQMM